jgi:acetoacetate decarboxylase
VDRPVSPFDATAVDGTPVGAPLVPPLPIRLRRTEILTVAYRTDRAAADALIPAPLELASDVCLLHVYRMHDAEWFGRYCESAVQIDVRLPDGSRAVYSPFLILASDGAVATGREAYGQPKKLGEVALEARGDLLVGEVARNGITVATATMAFKQRPAENGLLTSLVAGADTNVNLRVLPDDGPRLRRELVSRTFGDPVEHEAWSGAATLELRPNAQAPLHLLPVREVVLGLHRTIDLSLPPGRVVHRYPETA